MKVVVFGATGKVGRLVVQKLLDAGHSVTAFVYGDSPFTKDTKLTVVEGNVYSQWDVEQAVSGQDVVVSTLGSWGTKRKDVLTKGMENIIKAMHDGGVERVVSLTGADAQLPDEKLDTASRLIHTLIRLSPARKILGDGEIHMKLLSQSDLKWTVLRSPIMNTNGNPNDYEVSGRKPMPWETIHRSSVAQAIVDLVEDTKYHNKAPYIRRAKQNYSVNCDTIMLMNKLTNETAQKLRKLNIFAGILHLVSMLAVVVLSNDFSLPVTATYQSGPPGTTFTAPIELFSLNVGYMVALFLGLSAFFHFYIASGRNFDTYITGLKNHINAFRWVEYSLSSSVMIILISMITGISSYAALLGIFAANLSMILFGWLQEKYNEPGDGQWLPFVFGCIAGAVPWLIVLVQLVAPGTTSSATPPGFVYGIVFSIFVLFNSFALVQFLQYRAKGKWADYLRGERAYIILSFVAKSLLAWQIFANTLVP